MAADGGSQQQPLDAPTSTPNSPTGPQSSLKAVKDRDCPYCGQLFTSSSLGRHLDLYIKPKHPKPPDGVHDVEEIRRTRASITRRQPRSNLKAGSGDHGNARQNTDDIAARSIESAETPNNHDRGNAENGNTPSSEGKKESGAAYTRLHAPIWQATGVINDLPPRVPSRGEGEQATGQAQRINEMRRDNDGNKIQRPDYETESMYKLQDAAELGRAAEMALREVLGSLEAAKKKVDPKILFEEFDFFSLSFPGLCLAILPAPSTLFTQTPFASGESWTLGPPGLRQYEAMLRFVSERFNARRKSDGITDAVHFKYQAHLSGAWEHWQTLPEADCSSAWILEVLRSFTRIQAQQKQLRADLEAAQQHARHLETEFDRLSRCQLPREYLLHPPTTLTIAKEVMREVQATQSRSEAAELNYNAEVLLNKWRTQIRATSRSARAGPPARPSPTPGYTPNGNENPIGADMVMNGSVWGVNGPMPRRQDISNVTQYATQDIDYETPRNPGGIVGAADDDDMDAEAEADSDGVGGTPLEQSMLIRRPQATVNGGRSPANAFLKGVVNSNGKRPITPGMPGGRGSFKIYKERHDGTEDR